MKKFTPLAKGLFTGIAMVIFSFALYYFKWYRFNGLGYLVYLLYAAGITWTLIEHSQMAQFSGKFQELFAQGFRCFIIVTLLMVIYTAIFSITHPKMAEDNAIHLREYLVKEKNKTPAEIEVAVANSKKQFTTQQVYSSIFGTLIIGSIFTLAGAGFIMLRRNNPWT